MILPDQIGEAQVICYLILNSNRHKRTGSTEHIVGGTLITEFFALAICQYKKDDGFYLFYCNSSWEAVTDTYHDTIQDAKEQAEFEYSGTENDWVNAI